MTLLERFLRYVAVPTSSCANADSAPTTKKQFDLAQMLARDMRDLGIGDAHVDDFCHVYGHLPATPGCEHKTKIGFIAHVDTSPEFADGPVQVCIHENYDGGDVCLGESGQTLGLAQFPHLAGLKGRTLLTTDGTTLLGADDKAGIAEILHAVQTLRASRRPHGPISIAFTPDEEVGHGTDHFDLDEFDATFAYTVDGASEGEVTYENFNAASAVFCVTGFSIHTGDAKNRMVNASLVAMEINAMLPAGDTPRNTEGREGFFHLAEMSGDCKAAQLSYLVRDHSSARFEARKETLRHIEKLVNEKYGSGTATLTIRDTYRNMEEKIRPVFHVVEIADEATRRAGIEPIHRPVRGGSDGSLLSFIGLPCPNLGTGGHAFHGPYEHITLEGMEKAAEIIGNLVDLYSE